ncbi:MAG: 23S rRNA (adenine(2030)-N(6))-methyltransferase RlmJ, partial [Gammaproteobacteria bacterium]|nr:23S rRNA (adenine(2030)-N(6))-methyltransferase RlmJ [Gammaproteobacteria bacterium]
MLSYRHGFHAGNHADVLKHFVLVELLGRLAAKDKPFWYIDTHAGAGLYRLDAGFAEKQREFEDGIGRLW